MLKGRTEQPEEIFKWYRTSEKQRKQTEQEKRQLSFSTSIHSSYTKSRDEEPSDTEGLEIEPDDVDIGVRHTRDAGRQCDSDPLLLEHMAVKSEVRSLQGLQWSVNKIKDDDTKTKFYTGLPSFAVLFWLFNYLVPKCEKMVYWRGTSMTPLERTRPRRLLSLEPIDQFLTTLMILKVGLFVEDIAERFGASVETYSVSQPGSACFTRS